MEADERAVPLLRGRVRLPAPHGIRRGRLTERLRDLPDRGVALIVAPAGAGKTTLLAHLAEAADGPVAWLTLAPATNDRAALLSYLHAALGRAVPGLSVRWDSVEDALADLDHLITAPTLLLLDDVHELVERGTIEALSLLLAYAPAGLRCIVASRSASVLDLHKLRLSGRVVDLDAGDLRFRAWEVAELFRDYYGATLGHDEVVALAQRTEGWAAGLQLFHLATQGQPRSRRTGMLRGPGTSTRLTREYLTAHVLGSVADDLRAFLIRTSVLDELTAARCELLVEDSGAAERLAELQRRGLFTFVDEDGRSYRYHEVLRVHLLEALVAELGPAGARALHLRAARLLEADGALTDAVGSYSRSESWDEVRRVLAHQGHALAGEPGAWIDLLPATIRDRDPWVLLALARRLVAEGSLDDAEPLYRLALARFATQGGTRPGADELRELERWRHPEPGGPRTGVQRVRSALAEFRPAPEQPGAEAPVADLGEALAQLAGGDLLQAGARFDALLREPALPLDEAAALIGRAACLTLAGDEGAVDAVEEALAAAKLTQAPALERLARGVALLSPDIPGPPIDHLLGECRHARDRWGSAVLLLVDGLRTLGAGGDAAARLRSAAAALDELGAPVLAAWGFAGALVADLRSGHEVEVEVVRAGERAARRAGPLPYALTLTALAAVEPEPRAAEEARQLARTVAAQSGLALWVRRVAGPLLTTPPAPGAGAAVTGERLPRLRIRCLGGFGVELEGEPLDLRLVQRRNAELLRILGLHANRGVHREELVEWLWPGRDQGQGLHSLQVAVSALRKVLEPSRPRGRHQLLVREGEGYRLALQRDEDADIRVVTSSLAAARAALRAGDHGAAAIAWRRALDAYRGTLLPDDGPAEWVVHERDHLLAGIVEACEWLASAASAGGQHEEAARIARRGLELDVYHDALWRRLIAELGEGGNRAAARTAERRYRELVAQLEAPVTPGR